MVIAVASVALVIDQEQHTVAVALGSVGPTTLRCPEAEVYLAASLDWSTLEAPPEVLDSFGAAVSAASRPITDHRSTADYRRHAVGVLAKRLARRAAAASPSASQHGSNAS